jgi:hypothetical protein
MPTREPQVSDNDITLVQPERAPLVPVAESWEHEVAEVRAVPSVPGGYFDFVQQYGTSSQAKPFMLTRPVSVFADEAFGDAPPPPPLPEPRTSAAPPPPPLPEPKVSAAPPPPPDPKVFAAPPPPPPEPRSQRTTEPRAQRTTELPPPFVSAPLDVQAPIRRSAVAYVPQIRNLPSSIPPPVAVESRIESAPLRGGRAWSAFTVGPLSALVAALVSSLVWSFHTGDMKSADALDKAAEIQAAALAAPCTTKGSGSGENASDSSQSSAAAQPATLATAMQAPAGVTPLVSIESLPMVGERGAVTKAALVSSPSVIEPTPRLRASRARAVQSRSTEVGESSRASEPAPAAAPVLPKGPDRGAVAKAMARASGAASSCGTGPHDGRVSVSIAPSGVVSSVSLVKGFGDAEVNACVLRAFSRAKIPAYDGEPTQVRKGVRW